MPDRQTSQEEEEDQEDEVELRDDDLKDDKEMKLAKTDGYGFIHKSMPKGQEAKQLLDFKTKFFRSASSCSSRNCPFTLARVLSGVKRLWQRKVRTSTIRVVFSPCWVIMNLSNPIKNPQEALE